MKKALWTTDIHLKFSNLDITSKLFEKISNKALEYSVDTIIMTGDINDSKSIIRSECLNQIREFLKNIKIPVYILVGNHDLHNTKKPELGHSLESLKDIENVHVIDKPLVVGDIKFIPYIDSPIELGKELKKDSTRFLFCHNGIYGAQMNAKGTIDDFSLTQAKYKSFSRVFVGHYHNHCVLDNIVYLGSPFSHSFNESNVDKFIGIIDFEKDKLDLIKTELRQHRDFHIFSEEKNKDLLKTIKYNKGDLVRVTIEGNKEANLSVLDELKSLDVKFIVKNTNRISKKLNIDPNSSKKDILKQYLKQSDTDLDKKKVLKIGEEIIANL